jgi:hypothetical protein
MLASRDGLGATTLVLNPWMGGSHHQALYNATSFWPRQERAPKSADRASIANRTEPWSLPYINQSPRDVEVETMRREGRRLQLIPSFQVSPTMLGGTASAPVNSGTTRDQALAATLEAFGDFACAALTPAPSRSSPYAEWPYGGGAAGTKASATRAFNLLALPNDATRWQADAWSQNSNSSVYHALEALASHSLSAQSCADRGFAYMPPDQSAPRALVTVHDPGCNDADATCVGSAATAVSTMIAHAPSVGGFIIAASRTRG